MPCSGRAWSADFLASYCWRLSVRVAVENKLLGEWWKLRAGLHVRRKHKHRPRVNRDDASTSISTSIGHVWTGTTQAQAQAQAEKWAHSFRLVYAHDASTSISTSASISHVWTGTTQAEAQEQGTRSARSFFLCLRLCLSRTCKISLKSRSNVASWTEQVTQSAERLPDIVSGSNFSWTLQGACTSSRLNLRTKRKNFRTDRKLYF